MFFIIWAFVYWPAPAIATDTCPQTDMCPYAEVIPETISARTCPDTSPRVVEVSYYGAAFQGKDMANGEPFDMYDATIVAHKEGLPFGARMSVYCPEKGIYLYLTVSDRGPFEPGRTLDFSWAAARDCGILKTGVADVVMELLS
ncbi:MAG: septal ring lytic transglycosylase RlpA family protein [Candidatus Paceibacterota bacterium]